MFTELVGHEHDTAVQDFRRRISQELTHRGPTKFQNPDGGERAGEKYEIQTPSGLLSIVVVRDDEHPTKYIHGVNLDRRDALDAKLRLNISKNVHGGGKSSTLFVREAGTSKRYLCSRGAMTVYRKPLPRDVVLGHFQTVGSAIELGEKRRRSSVIRIGDLDSERLFDEIGRFAKQVEEFKARYRERR